jgi:O-antigen biosynthesis protein WbqP
MKYIFFKRIIDFSLSLFGFIFFLPVFVLISLLIKFDSKGPIFFKQKRIGINKTLFYIYKFRTMKIDTPKDTPTHMLENPERHITKLGKFLRKTSLDELPQILNILKGDMSFIGPRPALWNQYDLIEQRDKYAVHNLYPGITGHAQIKGRDTLTISDKAALDGEYVRKISLWLDVKIFLETFIIVFKSHGVIEGGTGVLDKSKKSKNNVSGSK